MKNFYLILFLVSNTLVAQTNVELAWMKAQDAVELMDNGKIDESIQILEECEILDPEEYTYPYEIAYALVLKKDYESAIKILKKTKKYKSANSQVYQMSGNCYSYLGKADKAIKEYEEGMKRFPNSGNLYLERGNIYLFQENYNEAVKNYETGIEVDPMFASNYYRLAKLYLNSTNNLAGLIYGELFMNIERTTNRTVEIGELLYITYQSAITLGEEESKLEFCEIVIDARDITTKGIKLPFCAVFTKNFIIPMSDQKELNPKTLTEIRSQFIENYFKEDSEKYPNVLFTYHKELMDNNLFEAYNQYLFQMGTENEFNSWLETNEEKYETFVDWYTLDENIIEITTENRYID